jgi:cytochrome c oxidase assembly protein subunit 15
MMRGKNTGLKLLATLSLVLLVTQIFLGGWTSSNYAALACGTDFPTCMGSWWPDMDFTAGFRFLHEPGKNYEFGVLDASARSAIQMTHRIGALIVFVFVLLLSLRLLTSANLKRVGIVLLILLFVQVGLGISNVVLALPLSIAVAHNLVAALLLLTLLTINHKIRRG